MRLSGSAKRRNGSSSPRPKHDLLFDLLLQNSPTIETQADLLSIYVGSDASYLSLLRLQASESWYRIVTWEGLRT